MTNYEKLNIILLNNGVPSYVFNGSIGNSIDTLVNSNISSKPYIDIILDFFPKIENKNEKEMLIRAISEKGNKKASQYLINLFDKAESDMNLLWTTANALQVIDDPDTYPSIIEICKNSKFGMARQMLYKILVKIKTNESYKVLINSLEDSSVKGHVIEAIGNFGNPLAISILENTEVEKGKFEYIAKKTALKKLLKKTIK